jgi:hypothetical protein
MLALSSGGCPVASVHRESENVYSRILACSRLYRYTRPPEFRALPWVLRVEDLTPCNMLG